MCLPAMRLASPQPGSPARNGRLARPCDRFKAFFGLCIEHGEQEIQEVLISPVITRCSKAASALPQGRGRPCHISCAGGSWRAGGFEDEEDCRSATGADGSAHPPRSAREARRRLRDDEAFAGWAACGCDGRKALSRGCGPTSPKKGEGRAAELRQKCHARARFGPCGAERFQAWRIAQGSPPSLIYRLASGARTRNSTALKREHRCTNRTRNADRHTGAQTQPAAPAH